MIQIAEVHYPPPQVVPVETNAMTANDSLVKAMTLNPTVEATTP